VTDPFLVLPFASSRSLREHLKLFLGLVAALLR